MHTIGQTANWGGTVPWKSLSAGNVGNAPPAVNAAAWNSGTTYLSSGGGLSCPTQFLSSFGLLPGSQAALRFAIYSGGIFSTWIPSKTRLRELWAVL
jgi:hypothetical protein